MQDRYEEHVVHHNDLRIEVKILRRGGIYVPLSYVVFKGTQAINHRLSDTNIKTIEGILADYCHSMNLDIN